MDGEDGLNVSQEELSRLTPTDYQQLQRFLQNEGQKSQVQKCTLRIPMRMILGSMGAN